MTLPYQKKSGSDYTTVFIAALAGAAAGVAVGFLLAPKSGENLRSDIGSSVDEYLDSAKRKAETLRSSATDLAQRGLREVRRVKDTAGDTIAEYVDSGTKQAHDAFGQAGAEVRSGARKGQEALRTGTQG